ncbi:DUF4160 domain-containing protein [Sphingorhabdus sp. IMCC26285]|uniref:DUF4160 domain-containing protein n=1 Tax=Sphingorhabdus profundilacus TaxID=2509718 RepID=A0A6I4LWB5_9SPHN|nr:DUF4160 domain-containing protein [Sphingorhabdus profundilacus]
MPVVFRQSGWRFHFFAYEGSPREPIHVHVAKPDADAKVWLYPEPRVAYNHGINARDMRMILEIVTLHTQEIEEAWHGFFAGTD